MKICEAGKSSGCCSNPNIRTINTMSADTVGNFEIRAGNSVSITTETNGIRIAYTGGITTYDNTDGNIVIDNDLFTINLADDLAITGNISMGGDLGVTGDAVIAGDLTVNGTYYTVHAEHVYTQDDYIILREGATTPLAAGSYAGFQVTKYDGTNDGRLVVDNAGVARVGDVGDEQPLLTREEAADLTDGDLLTWDAVNEKAVGITNNYITHVPIAIISNSSVTYSGSRVVIPITESSDSDDIITITSNTVKFNNNGRYLIMCNINAGEYGSSYYGELGIYNSSNTRIAACGDDGCVWNHSFQLMYASSFNANDTITFQFSAANGVLVRAVNNSISIIKLS